MLVSGAAKKQLATIEFFAEFDLIFLLLLLCFYELNSGASMFRYYNP